MPEKNANRKEEEIMANVEKPHEEKNEKQDSIEGFSLNELKLPQNFGDYFGIKKHLTTIYPKRPGKHHFFRINPNLDYQIDVATIDWKEEGELYLVHPTLAASLGVDIKFKKLFVGITRTESLFIWPIPLPGPDGRMNNWHTSAMEAAKLAQTRWVRVIANMELGAYEVYEPLAELGEPVWPELTMDEIINLCFKNKIITENDHSVLRQLRGEF